MEIDEESAVDWSGSESSTYDTSDSEETSSESEYNEDEDCLYSFHPNLTATEVMKSMEDTSENEPDEEQMYWTQDENTFQPLDCSSSALKTTFFLPGIIAESTPFDIFSQFVTKEELEKIGLESSHYVGQIRNKSKTSFENFKPLYATELYRFLAVQMATGLIRKPTIKEYWSVKPMYNTPFFRETMSRNRFEEIQRGLHFCNNEGSDFQANRMLKLGSLPDVMMAKFAECIRAGRNVCIDESLVKFKGRLSFKQYIPKKRARFGVKLYILADCDSKFIINVVPYQGETTQLSHASSKSELGYGGAVVRSLIEPLLNTNRILYIDNFFTSPMLASQLTDLQTGVVGTVRANRKCMPKFTTKLGKGDVECFSNGQLQVERWLDRREVFMLTNCIPHQMKLNSKEKEKPASVLAYNQCMGAVDELDKVLQPYYAERKCLKWYKKIWLRFIYIAALNSMRIFNSFRSNKSKMSFKIFLEKLIEELIDRNPVEKVSKGRPSILPSTEKRLNNERHFPKKVLKQNAVTNKFKPYYLQCVFCSQKGERHETAYQCTVCNVRLCVGIESRPCFQNYHCIRKIPDKRMRKSTHASKH